MCEKTKQNQTIPQISDYNSINMMGKMKKQRKGVPNDFEDSSKTSFFKV